MQKKLLILIVIVAIFGFLLFGWWKQAVKAPNPIASYEVEFIIESGENIKGIADRLYKQNLIRSAVAFFLLSRFGGYDSRIQAGDFRLSQNMDLFILADTLTHGSKDVQVTIPEGWRNKEIALTLAKELSIPQDEFLKQAKEGFMFPDTYFIPKESSASGVVNQFISNFNKKVTPEIRDSASAKGLTLDELVIIASMVEREGKHDEDRPIIASVILNRLSVGMKLDIDATVQYALDYQTEEKTWWKKNLTRQDLEIDSPYNTYKNPGLPPGAIANPGFKAIQAVINAPTTEYLYYISDASGKIYPAKSIEEHNANIAKYLNR